MVRQMVCEGEGSPCRMPRDIEHLADVRMRDLAGQLNFPLKAQHHLVDRRDLRQQRLQRNGIVEFQVLGFVNLAHAAFGNEAYDFITPRNYLTGLKTKLSAPFPVRPAAREEYRAGRPAANGRAACLHIRRCRNDLRHRRASGKRRAWRKVAPERFERFHSDCATFQVSSGSLPQHSAARS